MRSLPRIVDQLALAQTDFFRTADTIPPERWNRRPSAQEWPAGEVVAHLVTVERVIIGGADRITQKPPIPISPLKRMHLPIWLVESRLIKRKSPLPLDTTLVGAKEEMLGELRAARERTLAFVEERSET